MNTTCKCGIAAVDCDYHRPATKYEYNDITITIYLTEMIENAQQRVLEILRGEVAMYQIETSTRTPNPRLSCVRCKW